MTEKIVARVGDVFGCWTILAEGARSKNRARYWWCRCKCGTEKNVRDADIKIGKTVSCGCWKDEQTRTRLTTHGKANSTEYHIWQHMRHRCENPDDPAYKNYGERGIRVCPRWLKFENFYSDMGERPEGFTLERVDNDKGYSPDNCKWATRAEQANNQRRTLRFTFDGITKTYKEWLADNNIGDNTVRSRLRRGFDLETALKMPIDRRRVKKWDSQQT